MAVKCKVMRMIKDTYYIQLSTGSISKSPEASPWNFKIAATEDEVHQLRRLLDEMDSAALSSYVRSHIPFEEYHHDSSNDGYDEKLKAAYQMIYILGDQQAKHHIKTMGILDGRSKDHL